MKLWPYPASKRAFTLVEVLLGTVVMAIVIAGIAMCIRMGVTMHARTEASSLITNGVRFSIISFKEDIMPVVNNSGYIKILKEMPAEADIRSEDSFVYLDADENGGTVMYRVGSDVSPLNGSENVTSLEFSVPQSTTNTPENYMLTLNIEGKSKTFNSMKAAADIELALFNRQKKEFGSDVTVTDGVAYGGVLQFSSFKFENLKVIDIDNNNKTIANNEAVEKGHTLRVTYDISVPASKVDATKILWYASGSSLSNQKKGVGYWKELASETLVDASAYKSYSGTNIDALWWPLLIKKGSDYYLAGEGYKKSGGTVSSNLDIPTTGDANDKSNKNTTLYVYTGPYIFGDNAVFDSSGKFKGTNADKNNYVKGLGKYAYLRAWAVPAYSDEDGGNVVMPIGYQQWANRVRLQKTQRLGENFFNNWTQDIELKQDTSQTYVKKDDYWYDSTSAYKADGKYNKETSESHVQLTSTGSNNKSNAPRIATVLTPNDLGDARKYEKQIYGTKSYTCTTNYSIIIDGAYGESTAGLSVILNGYKKDDTTRPVGYAFYYDPGAMGYPIRLLQEGGGAEGGSQANGVNDIESPLQSDINKKVNSSENSGGTGDRSFFNNFYNPQYTNSAMLNGIFIKMKSTDPSDNTKVTYKLPPESTTDALNATNIKASKTDEAKYMQTRRRFMLTVFEYYLNSDQNTPRLLVRLKLLKTLDEVIEDSKNTLTEEALREKDPFLCGPDFYASEPAWYGFFVGQKPKAVETKEGNGKNEVIKSIAYTFKVLRQGLEAAFERTWKKDNSDYKYEDTNGYYAVQAPNDGDVTNLKKRRYSAGYSATYNSKTKTFNGGVFKPSALSPCDSYATIKGYSSDIKSAKRRRWIALGIWVPESKSSNDDAKVNIYSLVLAPGLDEGEIQAILEDNGKMFGMDETWFKKDGSIYDLSEAQYDSKNDTAAAWNSKVFGSSLKQSSVSRSNSWYSTRFTGADSTKQICVMSLQHTGGTNCTCPICWAYKQYQKYLGN